MLSEHAESTGFPGKSALFDGMATVETRLMSRSSSSVACIMSDNSGSPSHGRPSKSRKGGKFISYAAASSLAEPAGRSG
jgi:hypothetical protein